MSAVSSNALSTMPCTVCGQSVHPENFITCEHCSAMVYCSHRCKKIDWNSKNNQEHSHELWCAKMKSFMDFEPLVCSFPLSFTTAGSSSNLTELLKTLGLFGNGLWKYEYNYSSSIAPWDSVTAPGAELHQFNALWSVIRLDSDYEEPIGLQWKPAATSVPYEDAMLRAYVSPTITIMLSLPPTTICSLPSLDYAQCSLVTVYLADWSEYYVWRGLSSSFEPRVSSAHELSNPVAILLHWPLTIYYILSHLMEKSNAQTIRSVLAKRTLVIHVIGVEHELSMLPVFKELDYLVRPEISIRLVFIGTYIDPSVNKSVFHLSSRLSVGVWCGLYDEFLHSCPLPPDLIVAFNIGIAAYATWVPTLRVISELHVPTYFTDACLYSCAWGYRVIEYLGLGTDMYHPESGRVLDDSERTGKSAPVLNPFRSPVRMPPAGVRWGWFRNAFIFSPLPNSEHSADLPTQLATLRV